MKLRTFAALAAATLLAAGTAAAQTDTASVDGPHDNSLAIDINDSPAIGVWHRFSPRVEAGLEFYAARASQTYDNGAIDQELRTTSFSVGPAVKLYTRPAGEVRPYVYGGAAVGIVSTRSEGEALNEQTNHAFTGALALGLEWSPMARVSIGGHAGIQGTVAKGEIDLDTNPDADTTEWLIRTFTSGLRVQFYF